MEATHEVCVCVQILEYHVVPNQVLHAADFTQGEVLNTVLNQTLTVCTPLADIPTDSAGHTSPHPRAGMCEAGLETPG